MGGRGELKPLLLRYAVQHYEWGRNGSASEVGRLYSLISGSPIEEDKPYAELWMGTHDSGHSLVILQTGEQVPLKRWLEEHPEALGDKVVKRWGIDLPFLFKVQFSIQSLFFFLKFCVLASSSNLLHNGASKCALPYFQTTGCGNFSICQSRLGLALILVLWYELHPELLPAPSWTLGTSTQSAVVDSVGNINATACLQPH